MDANKLEWKRDRGYPYAYYKPGNGYTLYLTCDEHAGITEGILIDKDGKEHDDHPAVLMADGTNIYDYSSDIIEVMDRVSKL